MRLAVALLVTIGCSDDAGEARDAGMADFWNADLPAPGPGRTCDQAIDLTALVEPYAASTVGGISQTNSQCDRNAGEAPEMYFTYDAGPTTVDVIVDVIVDPQKPWDALVTSRSDCGDANSEEFCADNGDSQHLEVLGATGVFAIIVDGTTVYQGATQGAFTIAAHKRPIVTLGDACDSSGVMNRCGGDNFCKAGHCAASSAAIECAAAVDLTAALAANGSTVVNDALLPFEPGYYLGSCAFDAVPDDAEHIYQIDVTTPSLLDATTGDPSGTDFDTVLYLTQGSCDGPELACDDDINTDQGEFRSHLQTAVSPGSYFLFVDISSSATYARFDREPRHYQLAVKLTSTSGSDM